MANEVIVKRSGSRYTLESAGSTVATTAMSAVATNAYDISANGSYYPDAEFTLECAFGSAPADMATIDLYARPAAAAMDGTNAAEVPTTTFQSVYVGSFVTKNNNATQRMYLLARDVPYAATYYIRNNTAISTGTWKLTAMPRTYGPA